MSFLRRLNQSSLSRRIWNVFSATSSHTLRENPRRIFLANVLFFRQSGQTLLRRLREQYFARQRCTRSECFSRFQRALLGGCIVSFTQDSISDEELAQTVHSFSAHGKIDLEKEELPVTDNLKEIPSEPTVAVADNSSFPVPPLTVFTRQLQQRLRSRLFQYLSLDVSEEVQSPNLEPPPQTTPQSCEKTECERYLNSIVSNLNLKVDGTGFVDDTWEMIIDKPEMRVWRRPVSHNETSSTGEKLISKYEYRLCGTFKDISASAFLEVQLNLAYRREWDNRILTLEYLNSPNGKAFNEADSCDSIHWIVRFPFPLAPREYFYTRRWWIQSPWLSTSKRPGSTNSPQSLGNHAMVLSRCFSTPSEEANMNLKSASTWKKQPVLVTSYRSAMLIQSHGNFDDLGMDYYLLYYDDAVLPVTELSMFYGKLLNQFISQLHSASLNLVNNGLPAKIDPIVYHHKARSRTSSRTLSSGKKEPIEIHGSATHRTARVH